MKQVQIGKNDANQRLDKFLIKLLTATGQGTVYKALRKKRVKVNGKRVTDGSLRLSEGDLLELYINDEFFEKEEKPALYQTLTPRLSVVYEDAHILVMDKPKGMLSQSEDEESLEAHMRAYLLQKGEFSPEDAHTFLPSLCHRIDRNTDGLVLGAKDAESLRILNQKIRDREIKKFYLCETEGVPQPKEGEIIGWLSKDEKQKKMVMTQTETPDGVYCHTRYRVLKSGENATVEAELLTGRTHQIRAGFAHLGHPLLGDVKYGAKKRAGEFQHLTSYRLKFVFTTDGGVLDYLNGKEIKRGKRDA
ncbi:MAG: RluA family pseudouridine synthase [Clostridia bacterium]|nr:RluA family pseudouridine synthase [Clostridia bacterium]